MVASGLPAFPDAEGFGSTTPGGRGGRVLLVTNLEDSGPGSLREAVEAKGPRIVVVRVAGRIRLKEPIVVKEPYLTLAAQKAPGDGVFLSDASFIVATHDVVVRHLRVRLGDESGRQDDCMGFGHGARDSIFDHCSGSWSVDEILSLSGRVSNVTIQWSLIAESLRRSGHAKGAHGFGSLSRANGPVTWRNNLWAHNDSRNPRLGDNYGRAPYPLFDVRNNVVYNHGGVAVGLTQGRLRVNYVGNVIKRGPDSVAQPPIRVGGPSELRFFIEGNVLLGDDALTADNSGFFHPVEIDGARQVWLVDEPFETAPVTTLPAMEAYEAVLAGVGASLPARDAVDARIVAAVRSGGGRMIDSQSDVGGWPEMRSGEAPLDRDGDGMPDEWEILFGLDPRDPSDSSGDLDGDGYTNIEEYLDDTRPDRRDGSSV
ncbi:pectate lyase [Opitutales bacterium ASA1]|nr:pectate lyase [Opitutales bacterium ASA1]